MLSRKPISLIAALLLATAAVAAQATQNKPAPAPSASDVSGIWTGTFLASDGEREENEQAYFVFKHKGAELTGSGGPTAEQQFPITKGKVETTKEGTRLLFEVQSNGPVIVFDLRLVKDRLVGTGKGEEGGRKMTAKIDVGRQK